MIKFLDLHKINSRFDTEFISQFNSVLTSGHYILGQQVEQFETNFANYCGTKHCIGTANGLDALTLILKAYIELGKLKPGDEVIVPANTFIATVLSVLHANLKPVLVDANEESFNISVAEVEKHINPKVKAIIAVHLYGQLADIDSLYNIAKQHNLLLIEDAAQAHGAISTSHKKAGNLSDAAAFSFYPSKNLGCLGDGGAITTNDTKLSNCIKMLHNYGSSSKYVNDIIGTNSRLDELQAAFLSIKLKQLDEDNLKRQDIAAFYLSNIKNKKIKLPFFNHTKDHVFYAFVVRVDDRKGFINYLNANEVGYLIHYPIPPHKQKALAMFNHMSFPVTEKIHDTVVSIPISPVMTDEELQTVTQILNSY